MQELVSCTRLFNDRWSRVLLSRDVCAPEINSDTLVMLSHSLLNILRAFTWCIKTKYINAPHHTPPMAMINPRKAWCCTMDSLNVLDKNMWNRLVETTPMAETWIENNLTNWKQKWPEHWPRGGGDYMEGQNTTGKKKKLLKSNATALTGTII